MLKYKIIIIIKKPNYYSKETCNISIKFASDPFFNALDSDPDLAGKL